ncbi:MAG: low molecular weight phosphotyrosine protein phosphatase [Cytophagaceae bacterium]|jgi:protein-tyrosine phosphatase|nr:low molecular weight phosphotyrosine protein phosphatase [Cytophagaceae bacterium]
MDKTKILFVCLGNICRSPSAEAVMKSLVSQRNLGNFYEIDSAGTAAYHTGEKADARMRRHATKRGYNLTSVSRPVHPAHDFDYFDMIIGMDNRNIRDLTQLAANDILRQKICKMTDFSKNMDVLEVPDPYYSGDAGFELVLDILEDACQGLIEKIEGGRHQL